MSSSKKLDDIRKHFRKRLFQRYGITISKEDYRNISKLIKDGKSLCLPRQRHLVHINGQEVVVVYDESRDSLITALPLWSANKFLGREGGVVCQVL